MIRRKKVYVFLFSLIAMLVVGCGSAETEKTEDTDGCIVVQVPEGETVQSLFSFESKQTLSLSGAASGMVYMGFLSDRNSVVWVSDSTFLYVPGEARVESAIYYRNRLRDDPIPYDEFKQ